MSGTHRYLLGVVLLILAGCGTPPGKPEPAPAATITKVQPAQIATQARDQLAAATARQTAGDSAHALQLYRQIEANALPNEHRVEYFLGYADAALQEGDLLLARKVLDDRALAALRNDFTPPQRQRWLRLRGELFGLLGDTEQSLAAYLELGDDLVDPAARSVNEQAIWSVLQQTPTPMLQRLADQAADPRLHGWYQLALAGREQPSTTPPPAVSAQPLGPVELTAPSEVKSLDRVALLLPESGAYATAANMVRDGFLAAAFAAQAGGGRTPEVRLYDTSAGDVADLYQRATSEGAQVVIGPLEPELVRQLSALTELPVPVLSLNQLETGPPPAAANFHQFGLSVAEEARAVAHAAWRQGHQAALVLAPTTDWGARAMSAFREVFEGMGGSVRDAARYDMALKDFTTVLRPLLAPQASTAPVSRHGAAETPRRRMDLDMVFLVAHPTQGRQIKPTLDFLYAQDLPIYATSAIYAGVADPARDADLEGIRFLAAPWALTDTTVQVPSPPGSLPATHRQLFALGVDGYLLHAQFSDNLPGMARPIHGQTGTLMLDGANRIQRLQPWAVFRGGRAVAIGEGKAIRKGKAMTAEGRP